MAKTSMSEIARIVGQVARLDKHGKQIVRDYLVTELAEERPAGVTRELAKIAGNYTASSSGLVPEISVTRYREGTE